MMKFIVTIIILIIGVGCSSKERLSLYNWSYYIPDEVLLSFEKEHDIKVLVETYDSNEMMYAKLASGNSGFDIAVPSGDFASIMINQAMLQEMNHNFLPNISFIDDRIVALADYDPELKFTVPYFVGAAGIHVNTAIVGDYEESWNIFNRSDRLVYRQMSMLNDMREVLGAALLTLGYSVNSINIDELNKAKEVVLGWKKNLLKFDAESFGKDFASGNIVTAHGYAEVVLKELEGSDLNSHKFFIPREGVPIYLDSLVILKKSSKSDLAHQFINYLLQPYIHAKIADSYFYPTIMVEADKLRKTPPPYSIDEIFAKGGELKKDVGKSISIYSNIWSDILHE